MSSSSSSASLEQLAALRHVDVARRARRRRRRTRRPRARPSPFDACEDRTCPTGTSTSHVTAVRQKSNLRHLQRSPRSAACACHRRPAATMRVPLAGPCSTCASTPSAWATSYSTSSTCLPAIALRHRAIHPAPGPRVGGRRRAPRCASWIDAGLAPRGSPRPDRPAPPRCAPRSSGASRSASAASALRVAMSHAARPRRAPRPAGASRRSSSPCSSAARSMFSTSSSVRP